MLITQYIGVVASPQNARNTLEIENVSDINVNKYQSFYFNIYLFYRKQTTQTSLFVIYLLF